MVVGSWCRGGAQASSLEQPHLPGQLAVAAVHMSMGLYNLSINSEIMIKLVPRFLGQFGKEECEGQGSISYL